MSRNREGLRERNFSTPVLWAHLFTAKMAFLEFDIQLRCYSKIVDLIFDV